SPDSGNYRDHGNGMNGPGGTGFPKPSNPEGNNPGTSNGPGRSDQKTEYIFVFIYPQPYKPGGNGADTSNEHGGLDQKTKYIFVFVYPQPYKPGGNGAGTSNGHEGSGSPDSGNYRDHGNGMNGPGGTGTPNTGNYGDYGNGVNGPGGGAPKQNHHGNRRNDENAPEKMGRLYDQELASYSHNEIKTYSGFTLDSPNLGNHGGHGNGMKEPGRTGSPNFGNHGSRENGMNEPRRMGWFSDQDQMLP
ncbi:hypothetical protein ANCCEY_11868, partial [Ancylostoma ceylanicum]